MSTEKENLNPEQEDLNNVNMENTEDNVIENSNEETSTESSAEEKYNELNDKFLRLYAEFDNFRRRTVKEKADLIVNANEKLLLDLIPTLDDFERAIANNETVTDIEAIKEGFSLIYNKFKSTLESKGLKQMVAKGEDFNSDLHEAIANVPGDENMKGKVIDDVEKGYYLNEKVIRYAKVVVGQ